MKKKYTIEEVVEALKKISLSNPHHMRLESDGNGYFADIYKLTDEGAEELKEEIEDVLDSK